MRTAIIGAGMAGLAAAARLREAGQRLVLFDKGRGPGGRMATRRAGDLRFDHGAQFFTARSPRFRQVVAGWCAAGHAAEWFEGAYAGVPGMSAPARAMTAGLDIVQGCEIARLERVAGGWRLHDRDGAVTSHGAEPFVRVLLALPAPQIEALLVGTGVGFPALSRVRYAPCWALMLAQPETVKLPDGHLRPASGPLAWIARNGAKPGRLPVPECLVLHAAPDWSRENLERPAEAVAADLHAAGRDILPLSGEPLHLFAHRWRFALVEEAAKEPCLWDAAAGIGACGDWCIGPRIEAAHESGEALADALLAGTFWAIGAGSRS